LFVQERLILRKELNFIKHGPTMVNKPHVKVEIELGSFDKPTVDLDSSTPKAFSQFS
jgi:hypothetical protein